MLRKYLIYFQQKNRNLDKTEHQSDGLDSFIYKIT